MSVREDIRNVFARDPAARSTVEVLFCYPGLHAVWFHRVNHWLWDHRLLFAARFGSHVSRFLTGIEIHPAAKIGRRVFIDHGMGVVIGETAEVGDDVLIYMGVVLGGTALEKVKRHPTIEDGVVIGSGASVLGPITVGKGARIGAGAVVVRPVPPGATVVGVPGRIAGPECATPRADPVHGDMPDPMLRVISRLLDRQNQLEERIRGLERTQPLSPDLEVEAEAAVIGEDVRRALSEVIDPEVGIDIVDLGLVKEIRVNGRRVEVDMVLTTTGCPLVSYLTEQVKNRVAAVPRVESVDVQILDEPWDWERFVTQKGVLREI
ncbi:MAG TPA: serine O-acetyltransferase [Methanomicrobiales archaeon]|nr:serine O-acetyltransferase [Methanomicrobiales archaeon]